MFNHYIKIAVRYLLRYKLYTLINIMGLAVGITCTLLIMFFVRSEWSFDDFHSKKDRLYRVWQQEKYQGEELKASSTPYPLAGALQSNLPDVESVCRIYKFSPEVKVNNESFSEEMRLVDSSFFKMFDFKLVQGNSSNPFPTPQSLLIVPEIAKKYFGKQDPIGKSISVKIKGVEASYTIAGIVEPPPVNSSIQFKVLMPYSNSSAVFSKGAMKNWFNIDAETFVLLKKGASPNAVVAKTPAIFRSQIGKDYKEGSYQVQFQPITDIHLNPKVPVGNEPISDPKYAYVLFTIGVLILLVACINFITLSIGRSVTRALEVGVRKTLGAGKKQLIRQFWGEAFLLTVISFVVGLGLSLLLFPSFRALIGRELPMQIDLVFILYSLGIVLFIAMLSGLYPAFVLSRFNPIAVLKGKLSVRGQGGWLRKSLIVGQFVASIAMIVCTLVIQKQMKYMQTKDLGYDRERVVVISSNANTAEGRRLAEVYQQEISSLPAVKATTRGYYSLAQNSWFELGYTDEKKVYHSFQYNSVDEAFLPVMGMRLLEGRNFDKNQPSDKTGAAIVNEAYVKAWHLKDPIGQKLPGPYEQVIIGVVRDFNFESLHNPVHPLVLSMSPDSIASASENITYNVSPLPRISVRLSGDIETGLASLRTAWQKVARDKEFRYSFVDQKVMEQYVVEQRTSTIVKLASALSIFIACMGLFGLATLTVVRRTKEIGVRKVLGASVLDITALLSREFVVLVVIAVLIAFPIALWFTTDWLQDFAFRTTVSWWLYLLAALIALTIAIATVSIQAVKAALTNPVKNLRTE